MSLTKLPTLLICGSQIGIPDAAYLSRLWSCLAHDSSSVSLKHEVEELFELWSLLLAKDVRLERLSASSSVHSLTQWACSGDPALLLTSLRTSKARNIHLAVLTVLAHMLEYNNYLSSHVQSHHLEPSERENAHQRILQSVQNGGIQGLCIGMLSATSLAYSKTRADLARNGAIAIRLAMCIGAYIDLDILESGESMSSLAVKWNPSEGVDRGKLVDETLRGFPEAYISVSMDISCATITVPTGALTSLIGHFEDLSGFVTKRIDLQGRFHHPAHQAALERLLQLCTTLPMLQFPRDHTALVPLRRNDNGQLINWPEDSGIESVGVKAHEVVLKCILVEKADWFTTMKMSAAAVAQRQSNGQQPKVLLLGPIDCMPHSVPFQTIRPWASRSRDHQIYTYPDHAVAIVGASGRFPGSETLDQFWNTIMTKTSAMGLIPECRGYEKNENIQKQAFRGNYVKGVESFDHAFFRKSPREASYMDPQHRLALLLAYEALESSDYFSPSSSMTKAPEDVGCYIGVSSDDYRDNVNAHPSTAYSFTGTARAFAPGHISNFFGWTGPSLAIDTACSSSMVAIHMAVRGIQSGDCNMALAGGLNVITSPRSHQNLASATFLSPSGQCRPWDKGADGYCRGEGAGFVLMKRLSAAVADNDHILGVIVGSATNNSKGNTSITIPSSESQAGLYRRVLQMAEMQPHQVSYVEAHGTGTQRGDPVEYRSIRHIFGGAGRRLRFGSVKGNIGHSESASGIASLLKVLLMLQHRQIPPQGNLSALNPALGPLQEYDMEIPQQVQPWDVPFRAACVNNYGASGSNAAIILCQPPTPVSCEIRSQILAPASSQYPILISAHSKACLNRYSRELLRFIESHDPQQRNSESEESAKSFLSTIAFHLAQKQNHSLSHRAIFQVKSLDELKTRLKDLEKSGDATLAVRKHGHSKPVILVFAGQTGHQPRLSQEVYHGSLLLQRHLNRCDRVLQSLGLRGLFPHIFGEETIEDLVDLHCMQFSIQFAAAMAWIDAGLEIKKLVGHSLGQLTALCVSGAASLRDGFKMVSGRAALIQTKWGPERGCMLSVDADIAMVHALLSSTPDDQANSDNDSEGDTLVEVACYNSASSHIVVGSEAAIARLEDTTRSNQIRSKRLPVTHGFHSHMVDSIMEEFSELVRGIKFSPPKIPLEPCAKLPVSWDEITPEVVAKQSREPVYFSHAIARLEKQLGSECIWLEAGSGAIGVTMARRALETPDSASHHSFFSSRLHVPGSIDSLVATTLGLWKEGARVQFWLFHAIQRDCFGAVELPSYQFETSRHWLPITGSMNRALREPGQKSEDKYKHLQPSNDTSSQLVTFLGWHYEGNGDARTFAATFSINQNTNEYSALVLGRTVLGHTLAPSSVWLESACRAVHLLSPPSEADTVSVQLDSMRFHAPFGMDPSRRLHLIVKERKPGSGKYDFVVESHDRKGIDPAPKLQASGSIQQHGPGDSPATYNPGPQGRMLNRFIDYQRCLALRQHPEISLVQGTFVRKLLNRLATYTPESFGIQSIATRDVESVAQVMLPPAATSIVATSKTCGMNPLAYDNFLLVAEMHASNLEDCPADQVYICNGLDAVIPIESSEGPWTVYTKLYRGAGNGRSIISDIFVFNDVSKTLELVVLGAIFTRILLSSLQQTLREIGRTEQGLTKEPPVHKTCLNSFHVDESRGNSGGEFGVKSGSQSFPWSTGSRPDTQSILTPPLSVGDNSNSLEDTRLTVMGLVCEITAGTADVPMDQTTGLADIGVDSLSATELQGSIKHVFGIDIPLRVYVDENMTLDALCKEIWSRSPSSSVAKSCSHSNHHTDLTIVDEPVLYQSQPSSAAVIRKDHQCSNTDKNATSQLLSLLAEHLNLPVECSLDPLAPLGDMGLDSLVAIQLQSDICELFGKETNLDMDTTFEDLCGLLFPHSSILPSGAIASNSPIRSQTPGNALAPKFPQISRKQTSFIEQASAELHGTSNTYPALAQETRWAGFYSSGAHQKQLRLVLGYILDAFSTLGCDLAMLPANSQLPPIEHLPKYTKLVARLQDILEEAGLVASSGDSGLTRTAKPVSCHNGSIEAMQDEILRELPEYSPEHQLLHVTAPHLADCLTGKKDPLELLFREQATKQLLADVYVKSPLFGTGNRLLGQFLSRLIPHHKHSEPSRRLQILEIGGGTGGTTHLVLQKLIECDVEFAYTFTDISSGLVAATKRAFTSRYGEVARRMDWVVLNIEEAPPLDMCQRYDLVVSANCIHATRDLGVSCTNIRRLLRPEGGMLCLLELTRSQAWLDCVFGLLDGWWRFEDGRTYALVGERRWEDILLKAGFFQVDWSDDESEESNQLRLITALSREGLL